ncbi:zormin isoform X6 [Haematobia irritans]|uniref:zormin isoform X6 n=1 Tax=Haematobia irritans TaxID=7368 RepID=UPI003F4F8979
MERHRTLDSSMSSLYSGSNVSQTPSRQLEPTSGGNYHHHYPPSSTAPSPTPSGQGGGGGGNAQLMAQISQNDSIGSGTSSQGLRATTIGTVVVRCGPIQLVIALLQSTEKLYIKVVELEPKITTLGANLDESIRLQTDHDETLRNVQNLPGPMEEFVHKADKLLASKRISSDLVNAMADTLNIIWADILHLLQDRQNILHMCTQFHDKMTQCQRRMDSLEVACIDTMIPIEVAAVQEFLSKFKQLRIDMLTAVMAALKDGNELLAQLQELENLETLDTRPEHIKRDAARAVHQVQQWLEALHDRRNTLEIAWQTRKTQLEQCLALAMLGRELIEVEALLQRQKDEISNLFSLGECEHTANLALGNYREWKQQAVQIRDRALKITRAKEKLQASGTFTGDEACARAYNVLSACSEHLDLVDQREHWLQQSREFFTKADNTLKVLEKLEVELSNVKLPPNSPESYAMYAKVAKDVARFTEEPLRLGYSILDEVGRTQPETQGIKRVLDEIENRKAYIDSICSDSSEEQRRVNDALKEFLAQHNDLLQWLMASGQQYLQQNIHMGKTLDQSKQFLLQHHELMQDLEIKGELINLLLESIKTHLESLSPQQRYDVDSKAESLHKHWIELKDLVLKRVDCVSVLIEFFEKANEFGSQMDNLKRQLALTPNAQKLPFLQETWTSMRSNFSELKDLGQRFKSWKILDPYLDTKPSVNAVEDILNGFSKQQIDVTTSFENWTTHITEKREVETILETIMSQNEETAAKTSNVDTQLYPIFTTPSEDAKHLHTITGEKLKVVLQDIDQAQNEIQERVHTTLNIQTKDPEAMQKIEQVISNLRTLKSKLDGIKYDYKTLVESSMHFLESVMKIHQEITEHFNKQKHNQQNSNEAIERCIAEHEKFRDVSMERFRSLITQSEILIDRVRALEPAGAKEVDTDRILKLMENLRIYFESCNGERMNSLERLEKLDKFKNDLQDINRSLDSVSRQLHEINGQNVDSLAAAKTTSLAFEYFERTIESSMPKILKPTRHELRWGCYLHTMELLEKRIEKFTETTTEQLLISNPESEAYFREELRKLNEKWQQFRDQVKQKRNSLNQATEFFEVVEKIDCEYREISYFYNSVSNKIPYLRDPVEASNLVNDIEKYVNEREAPLRVKLENAAKCTHDMNKVSQLYNDVMTIFQSFMKLKSDITIVAERLKNEERSREQREREAREQAEREKAIREAEARERAAREQEARLQAFREQAEREQMERDRLARELAAREQAVREEEQRLMLAREQTAHEQAMREQKAREEEQARLKALREEEARLQMVREQTAREQAMREQQAREEEQTRLRIIREEEIRLQTLREKTVREEEARIQSLREQTKREEESRMLALKEQMQREESLKRLQNVRDQIDHQRIVTENIRKDIEINHIFTEIKYSSPVFVKPLKDAITREGDKFTFECEVTGSPEPSIEWYKDGILIQNNPDYKTSFDKGLCRLVIEETFAADSARFSCRASNLVGNATTNATLSVRENIAEAQMIAPRIVRYLASGSAKEGSSFEFSCTVTGNPLPTVQWYKNDKCIDDSPDYVISYNNGEAKLRFEEVFLEDDAVYTCSASNPAGIEHCSASLIVEPLEPTEVPHFKIPLNNAMARVGQKVKLEALVGGIPRPEVYWLHNGKQYFPRDVKYEYGRVTLIIPQAYPNDAGVYVLTAKNLAGEAYSSCNVIVKGRLPNETSDSEMASDMEPTKPTVQLSLKDVSIVEGKPLRLDCIIVGQPEPEVIWYHNEKPIKESADLKLLFQGDKCSLIIQEAFADDAGNYKVVAINSAGEASSSCDVKVTPSTESETASVAGSESKTEVKKTETVTVEKKVEEVVVEDVGEDEEDGQEVVVEEVEEEEEEEEAEAEVVEDDSCLEFVKKFEDQSAEMGEMVKFEVVLKAKPKATVAWFFNGNEVKADNDNFVIASKGDEQYSLTIKKMSTATAGKVEVRAKNTLGVSSVVAFLGLSTSELDDMTDDETQSLTQDNSASASVTIEKKVVTTTTTQSEVKTTNGEPASQIPDIVDAAPKEMVLLETTVTGSPTHGHDSAPNSPAAGRKAYAPRFTTPLAGKIVDQGTNVSMEAVVDGHPTPDIIKVEKNGFNLAQNDRISIEAQNNHVVIGVKNVNHSDAGRYAVTASNVAGQATTTADLIVKKSIFPPVFGKRLQAQVMKKNEKIVMEVEVTGLPAPTVVWMKDEKPLNEVEISQHRLLVNGNCHTLIIERAQISDSGKYMVKATNAAGEAKSIADCAVLEPTPERMQEVVKTVVFERPDAFTTEGYSVTSMTKNVSYNMSSTTGGAKPFASEPVHQQQQPPMAYKPVAAPSPIPAQRKTPAAEYSDYSSEIDERFRSVSRASENEIKGYRVVQPPTPVSKPAMNGHKSPAVVVTPSPMEFEPTPPTMGPSYAKPQFNNYQQQQSHQTKQFSQSQQTVFKPKPVAAKFLAAAAQQQQNFAPPPQPIPRDFKHQPPRGVAPQPGMYYNAVAGSPVHVPSMATETKNSMQMKESSESCQRMVNMQQTQRVMHFDNQQQNYNNNNMGHQYQQPMEQFPYSPTPSPRGSTPGYQRVPPPATPTKFVPGHFRGESNYSHIDNVRIAPLWTPNGHSGPMRYRHVDAPQGNRSSSLPRTYERVLSPMEFDRGPEMPTKIQVDVNTIRRDRANNIGHQNRTQSLNRNSSMRSHQQYYQTNAYDQGLPQTFPRDDMNLKVGSPPRYGGVGANWQSQAEHQGKSMSSSFMQKTQKFSENIKEDMHKYGSNGSASPMGYRVQRAPSEGDNRPQAYRDESRVSQYEQGTQTEILLITEPSEGNKSSKEKKEGNDTQTKCNGHKLYRTIERESSLTKKQHHDESDHNKLRKSASFSSSSNTSVRGLEGSNTISTSSSTLSLRSSPLRSSCRTLKSGKINTFQKWETTVESVSYVTTKTVAIDQYPLDKSSRSRSVTPTININVTEEPHTTNGLKENDANLTNARNEAVKSSKGKAV